MTEEPEPKKSRLMPIAVGAGALIVLAVVFTIGVAMSGTKTPEQNTEPVVTDSLEVIIDIRDFKYFPRDISVPSGARVTWLNYDNEPHTATEVDSGAWDTEVIRRDQSASLIFDGPSTFNYYCTLHAYMRGKLTVRAPGETIAPTAPLP